MNDRDSAAERARAVLLQLVLITMTVVIGFLVIDLVTSALAGAEQIGNATGS